MDISRVHVIPFIVRQRTSHLIHVHKFRLGNFHFYIAIASQEESANQAVKHKLLSYARGFILISKSKKIFNI